MRNFYARHFSSCSIWRHPFFHSFDVMLYHSLFVTLVRNFSLTLSLFYLSIYINIYTYTFQSISSSIYIHIVYLSVCTHICLFQIEHNKVYSEQTDLSRFLSPHRLLSSLQMFADGGAFAHIHVPQYPLNMGDTNNQVSNTIQLQVDANGNRNFDAIIKQKLNSNKVSSSFLALLKSSFPCLDCVLQLRRFITKRNSWRWSKSSKTIRRRYERSKFCHNRHDLFDTNFCHLENRKNPSSSRSTSIIESVRGSTGSICRETSTCSIYSIHTFTTRSCIQFRCQTTYHSNGRSTKRSHGTTSIQVSANSRSIVVLSISISSYRINKKLPRGPPSPPVPILHSPTRKVTVKEQQDWKIPPCISNWKNAKVCTCFFLFNRDKFFL